MKFIGGHSAFITGRPASKIESLPSADALSLPLFSPRFNFSNLLVQDGDSVTAGQVLADDPGNFSVPLLAPVAGTVKVDAASRHITLEQLSAPTDDPITAAGSDAEKLIRLGAWQYFDDACTRRLPNPAVTPKAVVVSTMQLDSCMARGNVLLQDAVQNFAEGLKQIHNLAGDVPFYITVPAIAADLAEELRKLANSLPWLTTIEAPVKYPYGRPKLTAQLAGLDTSPEASPIWTVGVAGVLAVDRALNQSKPCLTRIISIGGPAAGKPAHFETVVGYPIKAILQAQGCEGPLRTVSGGAFSGDQVGDDQLGIDAECSGLTLIPESTEREVMAFAQPGFGKHAFMRNFWSALRPKFNERVTTSIRGEHRPCVTCGSCQSLCAAGIMPFMVHRLVDNDMAEQATRIGLNKCVRCGLCSYVCLSKRKVSRRIWEAQDAAVEKAFPREDAS